MDPLVKDSRPPPQPGTADTVEPGGVFAVLRTSAVKALPEAILVLVMGNIAVGMVGGIWHQMAPSLPPGMDGKTFSSAGHSLSSILSWKPIREHQFLIVYTIFFLHNLRLRLFGKPRLEPEDPADSEAWSERRRLVRGWFGVIVVNAFGAMLSALALYWAQQFSLSQFLWHAVLAPVGNFLQSLMASIFGASSASRLQDWISWYGANQFKFNFWLLYLAAICDDLGIPNLKTLGRWGWRRLLGKLTGAKCLTTGH